MSVNKKPKAKVIGEDSNIFVTLGISIRALKSAGLHDKAEEMRVAVMSSTSYDDALNVMQEYVDFE